MLKLNLPFACLLVIIFAFVFESCKKKGESNDPPDEPPAALFGSWKRLVVGTEYWEFVKDDDSSYIMREDLFHWKSQQSFKASSKTVTLEGFTYGFQISNDTLYLRQAKTITHMFTRADNQLYNHTTWVKQVKILKVIPLPRLYIASDADRSNFGVAGDTIYYQDNFRRCMSYNTIKDEYYDSFAMSSKQRSICMKPPYFYYLDESNVVKRSIGYSSNVVNINFPGLSADKLSIDKATGTFYFFKYPNMFSCNEGEAPNKIPAFQVLSGNDMLFYRDNEFLVVEGLDVDFFVRFSYDSTKTKVLQSYDIIPGYDQIEDFGTDGKNTWVCALNNKTGQYELLKLELE